MAPASDRASLDFARDEPPFRYDQEIILIPSEVEGRNGINDGSFPIHRIWYQITRLRASTAPGDVAA
ncbi:hypothetical protein STAQ_15590 [Allostella sp. ATCC 35155]|nr:hypothetical protein STAQ_15590 [Stella sp. ATCC 35155]